MAKQKIETKSVKHTFTQTELLELGEQLSSKLVEYNSIDKEFDSLKQQYKSKLETAEAESCLLRDKLHAKWEFRPTRVFPVFRPKDRQKDYYLEGADPKKDKPVLTEEMTGDDFQTDLLQTEAKFERRAEIELFKPAGDASGAMILGRQNDRWYAALSIVVDGHATTEQLTTEGKAFKERKDAVAQAGKRAMNWLTEKLGKDNAKGFEASIRAAVDSQKEVVE